MCNSPEFKEDVLCPSSAVCEDFYGSYKCICTHQGDANVEVKYECQNGEMMQKSINAEKSSSQKIILVSVLVICLTALILAVIFMTIKHKGLPTILGRRFPYIPVLQPPDIANELANLNA